MTVYTTDQLVSGEIRKRTDDFRLDLLDSTGSSIGTLPFDQDQPPVITWDALGRLQRTLRSVIVPAGTRSDLDVVGMAVRVVATMQNGTEWPLGVFRWADKNALQRSWGDDLATSLVDRSTILDQEMTRAVGLRPNQNPVLAARGLALEVLPPEQVEFTDPGEVVRAPMSWAPGTSRLEVMANMLAQVGHTPPYFDRNGICQLQPAVDPLTAPDPIQWPLGYPVAAGSRNGTDTLLDTPNAFIVYDASGQGTGLRGIYKVPDSAPHSQARRGFPVPRTKGVSGLANQAAANRQAYAMSITDGGAFEFQHFSGAFNPYHDAWSPVEFRLRRWLEVGWRLVCRNGGAHDHALRVTYGEGLA